MRASIFGKWVRSHPIQAYLIIPGVMGLVAIAMYFAGSTTLQYFLAGNPLDPHPGLARDLGAINLMQDLFLLTTLFFGIRSVVAARGAGARVITVLLLALLVLSLTAEVDYGKALMRLVTGHVSLTPREAWELNWQKRGGATPEQVDQMLLLGVQLVVLGLFVALPLLLRASRNRTVRMFAPVGWAAVTALMAGLLWHLAVILNGEGQAILNGEAGNLEHHLSEFLELNLYYLLLLYCATLHDRLIFKLDAPVVRQRGY